MASIRFCALDVHKTFCELAVVSPTGRVVHRHRCATTIPELAAALAQVPRPRHLTFEEGPLADWLARALRPHVDQLVVCDPRRNRLVAADGDKDDPIDAAKLADLLRGGYVKAVHQAGALERAVLKQHVGFYHDQVRDRVRVGNRVLGWLLRHGLFPKRAQLHDPAGRARWRQQLPAELLRTDLDALLAVYDLLRDQEAAARQTLRQRARGLEPVRRFTELPGFAWVRAVTAYVYLDTPERFRSKAALWRYCGLGLQRRHSGAGPAWARLDPRGHRRLKNVFLAAARTAAAGAGPLAERYARWIEEGHPAKVARRNLARSLAASLWALWKTGEHYDPHRVRGAEVAGPPAGR